MEPTLLVLAAGMGSRYGGVKQIDPIGKNSECLLDFSTFDAKRAGFGKVVFIIRKDIEKDFRKRLFNRIAKNFDAEYVFQDANNFLTKDEIEIVKKSGRQKPWGTVHAVLCAKDKIHEPFAVINSDDYYGRSAFETLGAYLSVLTNDSTDHAMVGYMLGNTMSRNGSVSRGICETRDRVLKSITENTKIYYSGENFTGNEILTELNGDISKLSGKETVSMNLFGFAPSIFKEFENYWEAFKKENLTSPKAEALLPTAVANIISKGRGQVNVFTSTENWFGMTYPEDKQLVKDEISKKIKLGYYPTNLWNS